MLDHAAIIRQWSQQVDARAQSLVEAFIGQNGAFTRYLFGCNDYAKRLSQVIPIDGFVDDYASPMLRIDGKPVIHSDQLPGNAIVVNCVSSTRPVTAMLKLEKLPIHGAIAASELSKIFPERFPLPDFVTETRTDLELHASSWSRLRDRLEDPTSRKVLDDLLRFRVTGDMRFMTDYSFRPQEQYFEDFVGLGDGEVFVDAGGFNGDTTEEFCRRVPNYGKVFLFEPSPNNIEQAQVRLRGMRDIHFCDVGLSSTQGQLGFDPNAGSASAICENAPLQIKVTTLDQEIREKITFIKMDLEGWEQEALKGAERHILDHRPKLAISVYHHPADFWKIPKYILGLRNDYKITLRHYTEGWSETVMYFL